MQETAESVAQAVGAGETEDRQSGNLSIPQHSGIHSEYTVKDTVKDTVRYNV